MGKMLFQALKIPPACMLGITRHFCNDTADGFGIVYRMEGAGSSMQGMMFKWLSKFFAAVVKDGGAELDG